jgi:hypothetical protein
MKLLAELIEQQFKSHSIGRADWKDHVVLHIWHIPDPDANVLIHIAPPSVLVSLAKRPEGSADSYSEAWSHCEPTRLHLASPDFMDRFVSLVKHWAAAPVNTGNLTGEGEALESYLP